MSLTGALNSGVSGLQGQANAIGVISDNISNINTIGYKAAEGLFETLVTNSGTVAYNPGGVLGKSRSNISSQGLLQTTSNNTDIAISGKGFFVVNTLSDSSGAINFTRAGSFRQDATGNFQNAAGAFLQGWPLDRDGRLPGEAGNSNATSSTSPTSLTTVNVASLTGSAAATSSVEISANLNAAQAVSQGAGTTVTMDSLSNSNYQINAEEIIVPTATNSIARGDRFEMGTETGILSTFRYDGFSFSRNIGSAAAGDDGVTRDAASDTLGDDPFAITTGDQTVTVTHANHGLSTGDTITISGITAAIQGVPAADFNESFIVTRIDEDSYSIEVATTPTGTTPGAGGATVNAEKRPYTGNILDATSATSTFLGTTGTTGFTDNALNFTIETASTNTSTFTYTSGTPNSQLGQFNNLNNLATAISAVDGLTARVVSSVLYVSPIDANEAISFTNGDPTGEGAGTSLKNGLDWVGELGLKNTLANGNADIGRFTTLSGLAAVVNEKSGFSATVNNPNSTSTIDLFVDDPLREVFFKDRDVSATNRTMTGGARAEAVNGSNQVDIFYQDALLTNHGFKAGDIITLDPTNMVTSPLVWPTTSPATTAFTTDGATAVVSITDTAHGFTNGDVIDFDYSSATGYPTANIGGIPIYEFEGLHTVTVVDPNTYTITLNSASTAVVAAGGPGGTFTASPTIGGIPLTEFQGSFEVVANTTASFTIELPTTATSSESPALTGLAVASPTNSGSLIGEFGFSDIDGNSLSLNSGGFTAAQTTGNLGPAYDPTDSTKNMASGSIAPQYFTNIRMFDSLGTGHDLRTAFLKTSVNTWAVEVYVVPASDVVGAANGQIATGNLVFNGDGSLSSISAGISDTLDDIVWTNGAEDTESLTFNWGTAGDPASSGTDTPGGTDGLSQFDTDYKLNFANQNGVPVGELIGVEIDDVGVVTARFNNGEEQDLFKIPLADFANPDGLGLVSGNLFQESINSGTVNLREAGTNGTGNIQSSTLESSNAELSEQLTNMIIVQRAYQANTRTITTSDELLEELNNILR